MSWTELVVDDDAADFRVDRAAYRDPSILELERTRIFDRSWIYAAHTSELPQLGDFVTRTLAGHPMIVVRGRDGEIRALYNTCAHRGAMVCAHANGNARSFTCPYHAWTYDDRGRLRGLPGRESYGDGFAMEGRGLTVARIDSYRDFVFVAFGDVPPLRDYLAGAAEQLDLIADQALGDGMEVVAGSQRYQIRANWKLLAENSIDTYHVLSLHRRYLDYLTDQGVRPTRPGGRAFQLGNGHGVSETSPPVSGKPVAHWGPPMPVAHKPAIAALQHRLAEMHGDERARAIGQTHRQVLIFPNLMVIDGCATTIRTWQPLSHDRMEVTAWALAPKRQAAEDRALALQSFLTFFGPGGFSTPDDVEILERCQDGLANTAVRWMDCSRGMGRGAVSLDSELPLRSFWRRWLQLMAEDATVGTGTR